VHGEFLIMPSSNVFANHLQLLPFLIKSGMRDLIILFVHVIVTICRLLSPGGARSVIAESILLKQQLLILSFSEASAESAGF
jgi:hypothetical protein